MCGRLVRRQTVACLTMQLGVTTMPPEGEVPKVLDDNAPLPAALARLPSRADVMGHAVVVDGARWWALTDAAGLPAPGPLLAEEGTVTVTRADVFAVGDASIAEENAIELFYASLAWGLGTKARQLSTRLSAFAGSLDGDV